MNLWSFPNVCISRRIRGSEASCIRTVQRGSGEEPGLTGKGVLVGIVDSGVDYRHPDFRKEDGGSRILKLWDQSAPAGTGTPPEGYLMGAEYEQEEIDWALALPEPEGRALVPQQDLSGHGTAVLGDRRRKREGFRWGVQGSGL